MKIDIVVPGKISPHIFPAYKIYLEKVSRFCSLNVKFVQLGGDLNRENPKVILKKEAENIFRHVNGKDFVLIDLVGEQMTSEQFHDFLFSQSEITFVIGGPLGVDEELRKRAKKRISFSKLTFTHEFCIVILLEQIFRAFKIERNEKYHY